MKLAKVSFDDPVEIELSFDDFSIALISNDISLFFDIKDLLKENQYLVDDYSARDVVNSLIKNNEVRLRDVIKDHFESLVKLITENSNWVEEILSRLDVEKIAAHLATRSIQDRYNLIEELKKKDSNEDVILNALGNAVVDYVIRSRKYSLIDELAERADDGIEVVYMLLREKPEFLIEALKENENLAEKIIDEVETLKKMLAYGD